MSAAIYYHPDAYTTSKNWLMGRNVAGESMIRGLLTHSRAEEFWIQVKKHEYARQFAATVRKAGRNEPVKVVSRNNLGALAEVGLVYYPGPGVGGHALTRALYGEASWSICGITHTTSSAKAMDSLTGLLTHPVQSWDAIICTSTAVKHNVERLLESQIVYLQERLGASRSVLPQLPVIPLGVHMQDFAFDANQKTAARRTLDVDDNALIVLYVGRLSFHAKAHPLAMYQALEAAARQTGKQVVLIECGWHANEAIAKAYGDAAQLACPSVRVITLEGRENQNLHAAWAGADVFCSLSDNIQETFGIAPIEAMAAGLPVVVSDWDGYRDTVRDGVDGFRIPTLMPAPGSGGDLALRHALEIDSYDMYCGHTCSLEALDVQAATDAFVRLFQSSGLRRDMGQAGRERVRATYDWSVIIPQYEMLWAELGEIRRAHTKNFKPLAHPWPARMDPFDAYAAYPTHTLTRDTVLKLAGTDVDAEIQRTLAYRELAMVDFARIVLPTREEIEIVLVSLTEGARTASEIVATLPTERQPFVLRSLGWLAKLGVLSVVS